MFSTVIEPIQHGLITLIHRELSRQFSLPGADFGLHIQKIRTRHLWNLNQPLPDFTLPEKRQEDTDEMQKSIAWFQNLWSDETYRLWQRGNRSPKPSSVPAQGNLVD